MAKYIKKQKKGEKMAKKRMFNNDVLDTDAFLGMPLSAQALYFHLNMRADDDGFISNPRRVQKYVGASEDDLKLLIVKNFIIVFDDGVIVIKHWRMHNTIQKDRYRKTNYVEDLKLLGIKENKAYTLNVSNMETKCIQNVSSDIDLDIGLDKDIDLNNIYGQGHLDQAGSKNENDLGEPKKEIWEEQFEEFYKKYPKKVKKQDVKKWFKKNKPSSELFSSMINSLEQFRGSKDWLKEKGQYIPYPSTWLNQKRWEDETVDGKKNVNSPKTEYKEINAEEMTEEQYIAMLRGGQDV